MRKTVAALLVFGLIWSSADIALANLVTKWLKYGTLPNGTQTTLLGSELASVGNNACSPIATTARDFSVGGGVSDGFLFCSVTGNFTFGAFPAANSSVTLILLKSDDGGSTYENTPNCSTINLGRRPDAELPATTGQTGTVVSVTIQCPTTLVKAIAKNNNTGATLSSGTIKILPFTPMGVPQ